MCARVDEFPDCWTESLWSWCGEEPTCDSYCPSWSLLPPIKECIRCTLESEWVHPRFCIVTESFLLVLATSAECLCVHVWAETDLVPVGRCWSGTPGRLNRTTHSECGQWRTATTQCGHTAFHHQRAVKDNSRTRLCPALGIPLCQEDCLYATSNYLGRPSFLETDKAHYTIPDNIW